MSKIVEYLETSIRSLDAVARELEATNDLETCGPEPRRMLAEMAVIQRHLEEIREVVLILWPEKKNKKPGLMCPPDTHNLHCDYPGCLDAVGDCRFVLTRGESNAS